MGEGEEGVPAHGASSRDGARARHESAEASRFAPEPAAALEAPGWHVHRRVLPERFDGERGADVRAPESRPRSRSTIDVDTNVPQRASDLTRQFSDLACYAVNLANDLERWIAHGSIDPDVLPQPCEELREIASALETGAPLSSVPAIRFRTRRCRRPESQRRDRASSFDEGDIPF